MTQHPPAPAPPAAATALANVYVCCSADGAELAHKLSRVLGSDRMASPAASSTNPDQTAAPTAEALARIDAADYFVFVATPGSAASPRCLGELDHARKAGKQLRFLATGDGAANAQLPGMRPDNSFVAWNGREKRALRKLARSTAARLQFDVFVSYSHHDAAFVRAVVDRLRAAGRKVWQDRTNLEHAEPWWMAIRSAIEAADTFVFVTTPQSLQSREAGRELEYAKELGKRIIPMPGKPTDPAGWPPALRELNQDTGDLPPGDVEKIVPALLDLLDAEPGHVRAHTRLLVRAVEWAQKPGDIGRLLWLTEFVNAWRWLARAHGRKPAPTRLHRRYIRWSTAGNGLALAVIAAVVALAVASDARRRGEERVRRAGNLALLSRGTLATQPDVSLLLGVAAMDLHDGSETRAALFSALARAPRLLAHLRGHEGTPSRLAFSPDGRTLLAGNDPGSLTAWEPARSAEGRRLVQEPRSAIQSLAAGPGGMVAYGILYDTVEIRGMDGKRRHVLPLPVDADTRDSRAGDFAMAFAFDSSGARLLVGTMLGRLLVYDLARGTLLRHLRPVSVSTDYETRWLRNVTSVAFTRDSGVAALTEDGDLLRWPLRDTVARVVRVVENDMAVAVPGGFTASGDTFAVAYLDTLHVYRTSNLQPLGGGMTDCGTRLVSLAIGPAGSTVAVGTQDGRVRLFDVARMEWKDEALLAHTQEVDALAFSPDGQTLASAGRDGRVLLWDAAGTRSLGVPVGPTPRGTEAIAVAAGPGGAVHLSLAGSRVPNAVRSFPAGRSGGAAIDSLGDTLVVLSIVARGARDAAAAGVLIRGANVNGPVSTLHLPRAWLGGRQLRPPLHDPLAQVTALQLSHGGDVLAMALNADEGLVLWHLQTGRLDPLPSTDIGKLSSLSFSRDGRFLAATSIFDRLTVWSLDRRAVVDTFTAPCQQLTCAVALAADGSLAAYGDDRGVVIRATRPTPAGQARERRMAGLRQPPHALAFSPDGSILAATVMASDGAHLVLWEVASGTQLGELPLGRTGALAAPLAFDSAGTVLVTGGSFPARWEMDPRKWRARACAIAGDQPVPPEFAGLAGGRTRPCAPAR